MDSTLLQPLHQKYVLIPKSASTIILKKSPLLSSKDSSTSLLAAGYSHYNRLKSNKRAPNKYDHFHEKTYIESFIPTFQSTHFVNIMRKGERPYEIPHETRSVFPSRRVYKPDHSSTRFFERESPEPQVKRQQTLHATMKKSFSLPQVNKTKRKHKSPKHTRQWRVLCVEDGANLESDNLNFYEIDMQDLYNRYIGGITPKQSDLEAKEVSLKTQAMQELLETVSEQLNENFTTIFTVTGNKVTDLSDLTRSCRVLLFSESGYCRGLAASRLKM